MLPRMRRALHGGRSLWLRRVRACSSGHKAAGETKDEVIWYALWQTPRGRKYLTALLAGYALLYGAVQIYVAAVEEERKQASEKKTIAKVKLGGHLHLTNQFGNKFDTAQELNGKWWLVYFGFVSCPTVCPAELTKITKAVETLESTFGSGCITPIFVTLDPTRDSPEALKSFLKPYHPSFVGLTGTEEQIKDAAARFRVYFSVIDTEDQDLKPGEIPADYQIDHSCIIYVMNPSGTFCDFFSKETELSVTVEKIERHLDGTMDFLNKQDK